MTGLVVFAHGSPLQPANDAVHAVSSELARRTGNIVETAFLDCAPPTLADAVSKLASQHVQEVIVVPYFLTSGIHLTRDLPQLLREVQEVHPGLTFRVTDPLDGHPALLEILVDRSKEAMNAR